MSTPTTSFLDYPHHIALGLVVLLLTMFATVWSAKRSGEIDTILGAMEPLGLLQTTVLLLPIITFAYLVPAIIVVLVIQWILGVGPTHWTLVEVAIEPALRIAVLFMLGSNFAHVMSSQRRKGLATHLGQFFGVLIPSYSGIMALAWLLSRALALIWEFEPARIRAANNLFALPAVTTQFSENLIVLAVLVLATGLVSYWTRC